jgi:cytochrome c biogenesis protein
MTTSTDGLEVKTGPRVVRAAVEMLSSMRFSISLLTIICIASVIGTVLKQHEPLTNYVNQFGPFWAQLFVAVQLNAVYSAWWFLLILAFLVTSTSLCIARNAPKILVDLRVYKENLREQSLQAFSPQGQRHVAAIASRQRPPLGATAGNRWLESAPAAAHHTAGRGLDGGSQAGAANKLGYIAAHSAIVLVCLGGLLDGDLIVRAQMLFNGKTPYAGGGFIADVKPEHRLAENATRPFAATSWWPKAPSPSTAILNQSDGILLQPLPFAIELKKFIVEYYSTGMPKLFASEIVIHDKETGEKIPARVEVNHPARHRGIEIYQSSFDDGGSAVTLQGVPMGPQGGSIEVQGTIGSSTPLTKGQGDSADKLTLEYTALRVINVENFNAPRGAGVDVRKVDLRDSIGSRLGAANKTATNNALRNVGPSITYKLRDTAGQAREFHNYMLPVDMGDGGAVFLMGVRDTPTEQFRYLRVPADDKGELDGFIRLRRALLDPAARDLACGVMQRRQPTLRVPNSLSNLRPLQGVPLLFLPAPNQEKMARP